MHWRFVNELSDASHHTDRGTVQVLSVDTALSIQSHPDKQLAARLHAERPDVTHACLTPAQLLHAV